MNFFKKLWWWYQKPPKLPKLPKPPKTPIITPDGTLIFPQVDWEPPPLLPGYHRQSNNLTDTGAWVLIRDIPLCKYMVLSPLKDANCSCVRIQSTCRLFEIKKCKECSHKEPRKNTL